MKNKLVDVLLIMLGVLLLLGAAYFSIDNFTKTTTVIGMNGESFIALNRQSSRAKVDFPSRNSALYYKFTANQKAHLVNMMHKNDGAALLVTIEITQKKKPGEKPYPFEFGFTYDAKDGSGDVAPGRSFVSGDFSRLDSTEGPASFAVSLCVQKDAEIPAGFFVHGSKPYALRSAQFTAPRIGWDVSGQLPLYAYGSSGGVCPPETSAFDFSSAQGCFSSSPKITVGLSKVQNVGTYKNQLCVKFSYGSDGVTIRRTPSQRAVTVQVAAMHSPYAVFTPGSNGTQIESVMMSANPDVKKLQNGAPVTPLVTDLGLIMTWPRKNWRYEDYELYEWEEFPGVLFFDFTSYKVQNEYLTRLAYFAEKAGYRGTLVSDDFIATRHGYNAHDYKPEDLAAFFTEARRQHFKLNAREQSLCGILLANGIIVYDEPSGTYLPGNGAVISFSQESPTYLRWEFLAHESWHGIFFTDGAFRSKVSNMYRRFDEQSMEFLKLYWETYPSLGYDRSDEYLMQNEFMAYLMQQNISKIREYFLGKATWQTLNLRRPDLTEYVRDTDAQKFVDAGTELNEFAFARYGLAAGRVSLVSLD